MQPNLSRISKLNTFCIFFWQLQVLTRHQHKQAEKICSAIYRYSTYHSGQNRHSLHKMAHHQLCFSLGFYTTTDDNNQHLGSWIRAGSVQIFLVLDWRLSRNNTQEHNGNHLHCDLCGPFSERKEKSCASKKIKFSPLKMFKKGWRSWSVA